MSNSREDFQDRDQKRDIMDIHDAAFREKPLPDEGMEPGPWWLYAILIMTFAFGFFYIGFYWGEFSYDPHVLYSKPETPQTEKAAPEQVSVMERGKNVYVRVCQACHQPDGLGMEGVYPPLAETDYVNKNSRRLSAIILHGLMGEIEVSGATYNGNMPAWGDQLSDEEIASVLTYIRANFGNDSPEVSVDTVKEVRDSFDRTSQWTVEELNQAFGN